jgi:SAM-dependent methyltransferase
MTPVDYDHTANRHSLEGPRRALPLLLGAEPVRSLLDVGCGRGTWLKAAGEIGITDVIGVDGADIAPEALLFPAAQFVRHDLSRPWSLQRRFDVVLCLEVAEHLEADASRTLIEALTGHADRIIFSAACPGQPGQHHVNCAWPATWQALFNDCGFVCDDAVRWQIWSDAAIEPWYRQNIFTARRNASAAGREARLASVIHPELLASFVAAAPPDAAQLAAAETRWRQQIENGTQPAGWYLVGSTRALLRKLGRRLRGA